MIKTIVLAAVAAGTFCQPLFADGSSGAYLAGRQASMLNEFSVASDYNARVLGFDAQNQTSLENLIMSYIALGQIGDAIPVVQVFAENGADSQIADMVLLSDMIANGRFDDIIVALGETIDVNSMVNRLIEAWAVAGTGDVESAAALFDGFSTDQRLDEFAQYHKAMMFVAVSDFDAALPLLEGIDIFFRGIGTRAFLTRLKLLVEQGKSDLALQAFDDTYTLTADPELQKIRADLVSGTLDHVILPTDISQGMSEVFYSIASFVTSESEPLYSLIYARLAEFLKGTDVDSNFISAAMLADLGQNELAAREYGKIPPAHPKFYAAELGRFDAMIAAGNKDGAIEALEQLVRVYPDVPLGYAALGDALRRADRNDEAKGAYDSAIDLFEKGNGASWRIYYARGIVHSNLDDWENTKADFRKALELNPDQPQVLNYLGYSMVEKNEDLDEALDMIRVAVEQSPDAGYIIDSLGWAKFRLRQFQEAVPHLERAAELMPIDPIVNDHLGDAYWVVGRKREAEFQWRRALSFDPEPKEIERIRRKLDVGLDQVLIEEGEDPTTQTVQK